MHCERCAGEQFVKAGRDRSGRQIYQCGGCDRRQTARSASAFCGYRFPDDIIALAVRWYRFHWGLLRSMKDLRNRSCRSAKTEPSERF